MPFPPPSGSFQVDFRGMDLIRGRDCVCFLKGESHCVAVSREMLEGGWAGGQGVMWVGSHSDEAEVTYSNGRFGGFMLWGSDESADQFTAMTGLSLTYGVGVAMWGGALISTSSYEHFTYASRVGGGPLVPLIYQANDKLYFSLRGLWTKEDELTLSGSPLAPASHSGVVAQIPKARNQYFLGLQTIL